MQCHKVVIWSLKSYSRVMCISGFEQAQVSQELPVSTITESLQSKKTHYIILHTVLHNSACVNQNIKDSSRLAGRLG